MSLRHSVVRRGTLKSRNLSEGCTYATFCAHSILKKQPHVCRALFQKSPLNLKMHMIIVSISASSGGGERVE